VKGLIARSGPGTNRGEQHDYRGSFDRKPRGVPVGLGPEHLQRFSLCCAADGCRKRETPSSLHFLGRKVFLGAIVVLISAATLTAIGCQCRLIADDRSRIPSRHRGRSHFRFPFSLTTGGKRNGKTSSNTVPNGTSKSESTLIDELARAYVDAAARRLLKEAAQHRYAVKGSRRFIAKPYMPLQVERQIRSLKLLAFAPRTSRGATTLRREENLLRRQPPAW
jgi:hypothetical protein